MKLHILSDLHVEFGDFTVPDVGADLMILAGDTHVGSKGLNWVFDQGHNGDANDFMQINYISSYCFSRAIISPLKEERLTAD